MSQSPKADPPTTPPAPQWVEPDPPPAAGRDEPIDPSVIIIGPDGVVDEPGDADRPSFDDDLDPTDAP